MKTEFLKKKQIRIPFQALGLVLFVIILLRIDLGRVLDYYRNINPVLAIPAAAIIILFILAKSIRWKVIVNLQGIDISLKDAIIAYTSSLYLGIISPGRIGDFAKSYYLANYEVSAGKAIFSSILDRLFDIIFLVLIGYTSLMFFPDIISNQFLLSTLILGIIILGCVAVFWRRNLLYGFVNRFVSGSKLSGFRAGVGRVITDIMGEFDLLGYKSAIIIVLLTMLAWVLHYTFFVFSARALGISAPVSAMVMSISAAIFVGLIPVSISGIGTREIVLILLFNRIGLTREQAVTFSLTFICVYIIIGITGLICWMIAPFKLHQTEDKGEAE